MGTIFWSFQYLRTFIMNFCFIIRLIGLVGMVVGSVLLSLTAYWAYFDVKTDYLNIIGLKIAEMEAIMRHDILRCNGTLWTEWSECNADTSESDDKSYRKRIQQNCNEVTDERDCYCPVKVIYLPDVDTDGLISYECVSIWFFCLVNYIKIYYFSS